MDCDNCASGTVRVGVPTGAGWILSADNPLPADTTAVRFAIGEVAVGRDYFAELSLRVTGLPIDPVTNDNVFCSEVFRGDASMPQNGQHNAWRYFVPIPQCQRLDLEFDLSVDKLIAVTGDILTYTIKGKNRSAGTQTNVEITDTFTPGEVTFVQAVEGPAITVAPGLLTWPAMPLDPGEEFVFKWEMSVVSEPNWTLNRAAYISDELPAPGFLEEELTNLRPIVLLEQGATVNPASSTAGGVLHYVANITNTGTVEAVVDGGSFVEFTLPPDFSFCGVVQGCNQPRVNGFGVPNPVTGAGNTVTFTNDLQPVPGNDGSMTIEMDVKVGAAVAPGQYSIGMQTQLHDNGINRDVELSALELAPVLVDAVQSQSPTVHAPLVAGDITVNGSTSAAPGSPVTVFVNGNPVANGLIDLGGDFSVPVSTLYAGQQVYAIVQAVGEIESPRSADVVVTVAPRLECGDGVDNDRDGLTDFPDDPGCTNQDD